MARRFRTRAFGTPQPRRKTAWIGGISASDEEDQIAGNTVVLLSSFDTRTTGQTPVAPFTIVRTRGILTVFPTSTALL